MPRSQNNDLGAKLGNLFRILVAGDPCSRMTLTGPAELSTASIASRLAFCRSPLFSPSFSLTTCMAVSDPLNSFRSQLAYTGAAERGSRSLARRIFWNSSFSLTQHACGPTVSTGQQTLRKTCSATEPSRNFGSPLRPCVPRTSKSIFRFYRVEFERITLGLSGSAAVETRKVAGAGYFPDHDQRSAVYIEVVFHAAKIG